MKLPTVIWIMGLAGSGKSSIAHGFCQRLQENDTNIIMLDGDDLRNALDLHGHSKQDRLAAGLKYLKLIQVLNKQGFSVILSSVGMQLEFETFARNNFKHYFQVLVNVNMEKLISRNNRVFYSNSSENVMGLDIKQDELGYDLVLENSFEISINDLVDSLYRRYVEWLMK